MSRDPIKPGDVPCDARSWSFPSERVLATLIVDAILRDVFQGTRDHLRDQMLDVARREGGRIDWSDWMRRSA